MDVIWEAKENLRNLILDKVREFLEKQEEKYFDGFFIDSDDNLVWLDNVYNPECENPRELSESSFVPTVYLDMLTLSELIAVTDLLFCKIAI